jgi:hypothetical protein
MLSVMLDGIDLIVGKQVSAILSWRATSRVESQRTSVIHLLHLQSHLSLDARRTNATMRRSQCVHTVFNIRGSSSLSVLLLFGDFLCASLFLSTATTKKHFCLMSTSPKVVLPDDASNAYRYKYLYGYVLS